MAEILLILVVGGIFYFVVKILLRDKANGAYASKNQTKVDDATLIANANRLIALAEVMKQAQKRGDEKTYKAALNNNYYGVLPVKKPDGTWTNIYKRSMSFSIAGINYRSGIRKELGNIYIYLIPEPENEYDPNAIKVMSAHGNHLGYVPASMTDEVRTFTASAFPYHGTAIISERTDDDDYTRTFFVGKATIEKDIYEPNN